jgi:hypothetical protein
MKLQELRNLIREEVRKVINESKQPINTKRRLKEGINIQDFVKSLKDEGRSLDEFVDAVTYIYEEASRGSDMTDDITDELGDFYDAMYNSENDDLIEAYDNLRSTSNGSVTDQAKAASELLKLIGVNESKRLRRESKRLRYKSKIR